MNTHPARPTPTRAAAILAVLALLGGMAVWAIPAGRAAPAARSGGPQALPAGYERYLVLVANGSWNVLEPHPEVPGCHMMFCDGDYFQKQIMGRTDQQIAAQEAKAKAWFLQRFGIDVDDPANSGRILFRTWTADPRFNYRVYSLGGQQVPPEGYPVRDGGWAVFITDPAGYTLAGQTPGIHIPEGAFAFYGDYNILITNPAGHPQDELVLSYRADTFMTVNDFGDMAFSCQLSDDGFAAGQTTGFAQGFAHLDLHADGWLNLNIRNVITFGQAHHRR